MILASNAPVNLQLVADQPIKSDVDPVILAARIFRAANGTTNDDLDNVVYSSDFKDFLARTGLDLGLEKPVFDVAGYLSHFSRRKWPAMNAVLHYCENGATNGFRPHVMVDPDYLAEADETADLSGPEAYVAVLENTRAPFLRPNAYFDPALWAGAEPASSNLSPVVSFLTARTVGQRCFSRYFSAKFYCRRDPQLRQDSPETFLHYLARVAVDPSTECNPLFQNGWYSKSYDIDNDDPLKHFIVVGADQGLYPNPFAEDEVRISSKSADSASIGDVLRDYIDVNMGKR